MDEFEMGPTSLYKELSNAIKNSKIFLCCITKKYCLSNNCLKEINFASYLRKEFVVLMWEELKMQDIDEVGFIISPYVRNNIYKTPEIFRNWDCDAFKQIMNGITQILQKLEEAESKSNDQKVIKKFFFFIH
jgi:hypothetical protein